MMGDRSKNSSIEVSRRSVLLQGALVRTPADVDPHVAAIGPAQLLQGLLKRRKSGPTF